MGTSREQNQNENPKKDSESEWDYGVLSGQDREWISRRSPNIYEGQPTEMSNSTYSPENDYDSLGRRNFTNTPTQNFAGLNPRGAQPTDERIKEAISEMFVVHPGFDASNIDFSVSEGHVTLNETVAQKRMKILAEDVVASCIGVKDVNNQLMVGPAIRDITPSPDLH